MKEQEENLSGSEDVESTSVQKMIDESKDSYKYFSEALKVRKGDNVIIILLKIFGTISMYTLLIVLSPFLLIGLFLAFMVVL